MAPILISNSTLPTFSPLFPLFPRLPTEIRLKIWSVVHALTPPVLIPFHLCKSDLDYLRLKRKACHNYPHIFVSRMKQVPSILHVCHEAREVGLRHYSLGFDIDRVLSMGKTETDVETYTTCAHEISMQKLSREIYWDQEKDVVLLDTEGEWVEERVAHVWGGKTGVWFGRMRRVAMDFDTLVSCGIGEYLGWEAVDEMLVLRPEGMSVAEVKDEGRQAGRKEWVRLYLASRKLECVSVKFGFDDVERLLHYVGVNGIQ